MNILPIQYQPVSMRSNPSKQVAKKVFQGYAIDDEIYKLYSRRGCDAKTIAQQIGCSLDFIKERIKALNLKQK